MYYERSEPVAEAFGDLDPKIDARLADMKEEKKEDKWTGYHKIEKSLYQENKIDEMTKKDADQLLKDAKELVDGAPKVIKEAMPKEDAEKLKEQLEEVGASVELK